MSKREPKLEVIGAWQTSPVTADRWQSLQSSIARQMAPVSGWAQRSSLILRWRAVPASVSARMA